MSGCMNQASPNATRYGNWILTSANHNGTQIDLTESKYKFTINLNKDGTANGSVACNRWQGKHSMEDGKFKLNVTGKTKMRCNITEPGAKSLSYSFPHSLETAARINISDEGLSLTLSNGDVWFFKQSS